MIVKSIRKHQTANGFQRKRYNTLSRENEKKHFPLDAEKLTNAHVTIEDIIAWRNQIDRYDNPSPFLSKIDLMRYLIEKYTVPSEDSNRILAGERPPGEVWKQEYQFLFHEGAPQQKPSFYDSIHAVKTAGGIAILAHPGLSKAYLHGMVKEWEQPEEEWFQENPDTFTPYLLIKDLQGHGLDGLDLYYYQGNDKPHAENQDLINRYFQKLSEELGLLTTYSSDCHGPKGNGPNMGKFRRPLPSSSDVTIS